MSGKRISREKLTIKKMIDLYQAKCPQASAHALQLAITSNQLIYINLQYQV